jgi:hypothetical protein
MIAILMAPARLVVRNFAVHATLAMAYSKSAKMDEVREPASETLKINPNFSVEHFAKAPL